MLQRDEPSLLWDENSSARSRVMNCRTLIVLATGGVCGLALWMSFYSPKVSAQNNASAPSVPAYNPYPPGILPSDLSSEIARVLGNRRAPDPGDGSTSRDAQAAQRARL